MKSRQENIINDQMRVCYEQMIDGLIDREFGICNEFLSSQETHILRMKLLKLYDNDQMHTAGVGRKFDYQKNAEIRGDVISWLDPSSADELERALLDRVDGFITYLNQSCYTGIREYECHYAYYQVGSFYTRHLDQFRSDKGRKFSLVIYLNDNWTNEDEGALVLYHPDGEKVIYPKGGRAVFFRSDAVEHEVRASPTRPRLSIAGWLRN
ncbi:MAG: 2OG-Fe(II) oxygenase [Saprospiraceae bacterium]|nr:2OG-Fe(II) oxygenase [Saprospiraceae bacterium]